MAKRRRRQLIVGTASAALMPQVVCAVWERFVT